jgi:hypothetical protein
MALVVLTLPAIGHTPSDPYLDNPKGYDWHEGEYCSHCHFNPNMENVAVDWSDSTHADSYKSYKAKDRCAKCHSPLDYGDQPPSIPAPDPDDPPIEVPIPIGDWQGVTCAACHPSHNLRVEWGTPIGNYDYETGTWSPVYEEDIDDLCLFCHDSAKKGHAGVEQETQGFTQIMHKKGVNCVDCHMGETDAGDGPFMSHGFQIPGENPDVDSCGLENEDCHPNHTDDWAEKQIAKGMHEKGSYGQIKKGE